MTASVHDRLPVDAHGLAARLDVPALSRMVRNAIADSVFPEHVADRAFDEALTACVTGNVRSVIDIATMRALPEDIDPRGALDFASLVAELGIPYGQLERAYWVGVERLLQEWAVISEPAGSECRPDRPLAGVTQAVFPYVMRVLDLIAARYEWVSGERASTGEQRRQDLVGRLLNGSVGEYTQDLDNDLGYRLRGGHLALVLGRGRPDEVRRTVLRLAEHCGSWSWLVVRRDPAYWSCWLGFPTQPDSTHLAAVRQALSGLNEPVAVGGPDAGVGGFRRAHEQACRAAALRSTLTEPSTCLWYRDLRLESFLLADPQAAQRFIAEELGELTGASERAQRVRETLLVTLTTGSHARAAAELGVHENTVRLRCRTAGDVLGDALSDRRAELLVALRLRKALGPDGAATGPERG
ncbi:PucR C-terminal helix-turn-helix domain-containing protein [Haloechinothrix alba]|uniref:PucR C-terminal helix-turn-helix domain-containing protein n=1 Tax=Haloechinothrix alba TaxID=664784 RepID=A0A238ZKS9_9PSEU|nr:helix-turn-helix domain-containing protein [Haloechinothrix alba]SNR84005.1 PucR C-terminal helix-turn-helix domain-containing protein [Haloechinothrix alba]